MKNLLSWVLVFSCVCGLSAREFPLCVYGVSNPDDLKRIKKAGFSCIQSYVQEPQTLESLAQKARKLRLKVVFYPNKLVGTPYEQKARKWPVLAWYLVDEPDVHRWSREQVSQAHQTAKKAFPNHATALVIGQGRTRIPYYDIPDVMMMDWYPVPHLPLTSFGDNVRYTQEGLVQMHTPEHPLWGVVQIFDWKNFKQYRPDHDRVGRFPTTQEIRFMSYDGILNGATGLFFYTFNHLNDPMPKSAPAYWARVADVVKELAKFKKIMEKGTPVSNSVPVDFPLLMKTWHYKGHTYSVLLNRSGQAQPVAPALLTNAYKPLYGTVKTTQLPAYDVWILKQ